MSEASKKNADLNKKEFNFTIMLLLSYLLYLVGNFLDVLTSVLVVFSVDIYVKYDFVLVVANVLFYVSHSLKLFVFYKFSTRFRKNLVSLI
jgi:hypothetical protein